MGYKILAQTRPAAKCRLASTLGRIGETVPADAIEKPKKERVDGQVTGLSGELFVAAELLKRGIQTSVTFGNAKSIDLLAYNQKTKAKFSIQVKSLRSINYFLIDPKKVETEHIYVFVLLGKEESPVRYFIVPGAILKLESERFGKPFNVPKMPGIHPKLLAQEGFEGNWAVFNAA